MRRQNAESVPSHGSGCDLTSVTSEPAIRVLPGVLPAPAICACAMTTTVFGGAPWSSGGALYVPSLAIVPTAGGSHSSLAGVGPETNAVSLTVPSGRSVTLDGSTVSPAAGVSRTTAIDDC